jgi:hypothetical protein
MKRLAFAMAVVSVLAAGTPSRASLTPSESEQVRRGVTTATDLDRVRALVARPDLSSEEGAGVMSAALTTTPLDAAHASFLHDLVFSEPAASSRPVLVVATLRGVLARADAVLAQHGLDLDRSPAALAELQRAYAFVEQVAMADATTNITASARAQCARALSDHIARNAGVLSPQAAVGSKVALVRAQAAIADTDLTADGATHRLDAADALGLTGARRATMIERGILVLDAGGPDTQVASLRALLERLPALRDGLEAIFLGGDGSPTGLSARDGTVVGLAGDPGGAAGATLLWGGDVRSPPGNGWTTAVARSLATAAVSRAVARRPDLGAQVERDGGVSGVAAMTAMLIIDGPLGVEVAAARLLTGHRESAACLADAIGALAVFAPPAQPADGVAVRVGPAKTAGVATTQLTHVAIDATGAATAFRLEGHNWLIERDGSGTVVGFRRDGIRVTTAMLAAARV